MIERVCENNGEQQAGWCMKKREGKDLLERGEREELLLLAYIFQHSAEHITYVKLNQIRISLQ